MLHKRERERERERACPSSMIVLNSRASYINLLGPHIISQAQAAHSMRIICLERESLSVSVDVDAIVLSISRTQAVK